MSKTQFEHLKSTLKKISILNHEYAELDLLTREKEYKKAKSSAEKRKKNITSELAKIKNALPGKESKIKANLESISKLNNELVEIKKEKRALENEHYDGLPWDDFKKFHRQKINDLEDRKITEPWEGGMGSVYFLIYFTIGVLLALFSDDIIIDRLGLTVGLSDMIYACSCLIIPFSVMGLGAWFDAWRSERINKRISNKVEDIKQLQNMHTDRKMMGIVTKINNRHKKIDNFELENMNLKGLNKSKKTQENNLVKVNKLLLNLGNDKQEIDNVRADYESRIEDLSNSIKHLMPHGDRL